MNIKSLFNKNLLKIVLLCFLAPTFFFNFWLGETLLADSLMGFTPKIVYYKGISCGRPSSTYAISFFSNLIVYFIMIITAFLFIKNGYKKGSTNQLLAGSFFFYPVAQRFEFRALNPSYLNPYRIIERKEELQERILPFYGNSYNMQWTDFIVTNVFTLFYFILAWQVVFRHWDKTMRIQFFTFGAAAVVAGRVFWYYILGPILLPFPKLP